ncbi:MAG TPA: hypothetical protein DIC53_10665 [Synergistaceae bacterium]|nr:hypothetical protein [Synergistaceae bacterium]
MVPLGRLERNFLRTGLFQEMTPSTATVPYEQRTALAEVESLPIDARPGSGGTKEKAGGGKRRSSMI